MNNDNIFHHYIIMNQIRMPATSVTGEEHVKVSARLMIDSLPISAIALESLLERTVICLESSVEIMSSLAKPFQFTLYCFGISLILYSVSSFTRSFSKSKDK
jgi:hypothetical protein